jgi:ComF family protein
MIAMSTLSEYSLGLWHLIFPNRCPVCGADMTPGNRTVCLRCRYDIPLTGFYNTAYNPLWERLSSFVPIQQAAGFFFFISGSGWQRLIHQFKYGGAWHLAYSMGLWYGYYLAEGGLYGTVDRVIAIPLHWRKRLRRGYNQCEYLADGIAQALHVKVDRHSVRRCRNNASQARCNSEARWENAEGIFEVCHPERLMGHHILLVDDVLTTGATLLSCAETILRKVPDCRISVAVLAISQRAFGMDQ